MVQSQSSPFMGPTKVYRQNSVWRVMYLLILALGLGLGVFLLVIALSIASDTATRAVELVGAGIMALLGILVFIGCQRMRLVTSPQGVILYALGYKVYTPWDNIEALGTDWYGGNNASSVRVSQPARLTEGFIFSRPAVFGITVEEGIRQHVPVIQGMALLAVQMSRYTKMLPLAGFLNEKTRQELINEAKTYAPQTFQATVNKDA